jgi:hypothetical protein
MIDLAHKKNNAVPHLFPRFLRKWVGYHVADQKKRISNLRSGLAGRQRRRVDPGDAAVGADDEG